MDSCQLLVRRSDDSHMPSQRSIQILGIADALANLVEKAHNAPAAVPAATEEAFEAALALVARVEERREGRFPAGARLEPEPMARTVEWPLADGLDFEPSGFRRSEALRIVRGNPPLGGDQAPPPPVLELRRPAVVGKQAAMDPMEFAGPPPYVPLFAVAPIRYRYYADPVLLSAPRLIPVEIGGPVEAKEPAEPAAEPMRIGSMLLTMASMLKARGK